MQRGIEGSSTTQESSIVLHLQKLAEVKTAVCQQLINLGRHELASKISSRIGQGGHQSESLLEPSYHAQRFESPGSRGIGPCPSTHTACQGLPVPNQESNGCTSNGSPIQYGQAPSQFLYSHPGHHPHKGNEMGLALPPIAHGPSSQRNYPHFVASNLAKHRVHSAPQNWLIGDHLYDAQHYRLEASPKCSSEIGLTNRPHEVCVAGSYPTQAQHHPKSISWDILPSLPSNQKFMPALGFTESISQGPGSRAMFPQPSLAHSNLDMGRQMATQGAHLPSLAANTPCRQGGIITEAPKASKKTKMERSEQLSRGSSGHTGAAVSRGRCERGANCWDKQSNVHTPHSLEGHYVRHRRNSEFLRLLPVSKDHKSNTSNGCQTHCSAQSSNEIIRSGASCPQLCSPTSRTKALRPLMSNITSSRHGESSYARAYMVKKGNSQPGNTAKMNVKPVKVESEKRSASPSEQKGDPCEMRSGTAKTNSRIPQATTTNPVNFHWTRHNSRIPGPPATKDALVQPLGSPLDDSDDCEHTQPFGSEFTSFGALEEKEAQVQASLDALNEDFNMLSSARTLALSQTCKVEENNFQSFFTQRKTDRIQEDARLTKRTSKMGGFRTCPSQMVKNRVVTRQRRALLGKIF